MTSDPALRDIAITRQITLTTAAPGSHYGVPVLRHAVPDVLDLGPADQLRLSRATRQLVAPVLDACRCGHPHATVAAGVLVACWLGWGRARTDADDDAARQYMRQWPEGAAIMARAEGLCAERSGR